ncbi:class I SAM-dependent methyltransferase [Massilia sp. P8910]|uniref:class I SAM-dependent methyltransferase n=1 Tax=Massilia antarctica TaxID=2765360 RepID=UPI001E44E98E|nr:class I SAM-dependent methyltransferase [Massilia antarctica]MCE3608277.1 class I SAM-dependent methyltransferase [Massilia antarctica]
MISKDSELTHVKIVRSQQYFNKLSLFFYDALLYGVISKYAWGCSIARLDAHYRKHISANHLEVGVGTGFLLNRAPLVPTARLALMDLSAECLAKTLPKVARYRPETYVQNILQPVKHAVAPFDSISINYVLHCVPGSLDQKSIALTHLAALLAPGGRLFGTTVLSEGVRKNLLARPFMWLMNALGVFNNRQDNARALENYLRAHFTVVEFKVEGVTAIFAVEHKPS